MALAREDMPLCRPGHARARGRPLDLLGAADAATVRAVRASTAAVRAARALGDAGGVVAWHDGHGPWRQLRSHRRHADGTRAAAIYAP